MKNAHRFRWAFLVQIGNLYLTESKARSHSINECVYNDQQ